MVSVIGSPLLAQPEADSPGLDSLEVPARSASVWQDDAVPLDSPAWWTLDPDVPPVALREIWSRPIPKDGAKNPEWIPWGKAWIAWVDRVAPSLPSSRDELENAEISSTGIETILEAIAATARNEERIQDEIAPRTTELSEHFRRAKARLGEKAFVAAYQAERFQEIAEAADTTEERVRLGLAAGQRDASIEAALIEMTRLRDDLSESDWRLLTTYLRERVAPSIAVYPVVPAAREPFDCRLVTLAVLGSLLAGLLVFRGRRISRRQVQG